MRVKENDTDKSDIEKALYYQDFNLTNFTKWTTIFCLEWWTRRHDKKPYS